MSRLHTPLFIARRLSASADGESRGTMIRISIATTALCIAVMIVSLAVVSGFKREISSKVEGFVSRLQIVALTWDGNSGTPITRLPEFEAELAADPNIGAELAAKIVEFRENVGDFTKYEDLKEIEGIDDAKIKQINEKFQIEGVASFDCNC